MTVFDPTTEFNILASASILQFSPITLVPSSFDVKSILEPLPTHIPLPEISSPGIWTLTLPWMISMFADLYSSRLPTSFQ